MPSFQSKTKADLQADADKAEFQAKADAGVKQDLYPVDPPKPGDTIPSADENGLRELGAHEFYPRKWQYQHPQHALADLQRPGYFVGEARDHLRPGDEIYYTMEGGKKLPSEHQRGVCVVEEVPSARELPVILAGYVEYQQPTRWAPPASIDDKTKTKAT